MIQKVEVLRRLFTLHFIPTKSHIELEKKIMLRVQKKKADTRSRNKFGQCATRKVQCLKNGRKTGSWLGTPSSVKFHNTKNIYIHTSRFFFLNKLKTLGRHS